MNIYIIAMAAIGRGLSGSDRIFIELSRRMNKNRNKVNILVCEEGFNMCRSQNLKGVEYKIWRIGMFSRFGFLVSYIYKIISSIYNSFFLTIENSKETIVYSASDFWMDSLPGWILKKRFPKTIWIGTFYLSAPSPFFGFNESNKKQIPSLKNIFYYLMQKLPFYLMKKNANIICVTSIPDIEKFPTHKRLGNYIVIKGGVNFTGKNYSTINTKKYEAVFQGRFHEQKGVLELIEIWKQVIVRIPKARLAMIGDGPLMKQVRLKIKKENLMSNIDLLGFMFDGIQKDKVFKQSKIFVHPAIYDSGGMAAAEAMAFGLPGVSFDLIALKSYYPYGLLKAKKGDLNDFSKKIIFLLQNKKLYEKISAQGIKMIRSEWTWKHRAKQFLDKINEVKYE